MSTHTPPELWSLDEIVRFLDDEDADAKYFVQIPKFQRSIVWKEDQITRLVDSIYKGFPVGSLLAYKTNNPRGKRIVLHLVDGLQRSNAIRRFMSEPLKYAPIHELVPQSFIETCAEAIFGEVSDKGIAKVFSDLKSWFNEVKVLKKSREFSFPALAKAISAGDKEAQARLNALNNETFFGEEMLASVLDALSEVNEFKLPVNIYAGPIDNVPTIFERINSQGAQLSKYEILAASWSNTRTKIDNPDVVTAINAKYQRMIDEGGYEIEGFEDGAGVDVAREYNLYEYLFGLGKVLAKQFPTLFHSPDQADENSPVAFQIFTVAHKLPVAKMGRLAEVVKKSPAGYLDIAAAERAIIEAARVAENALHKHLSFKLNQQEVGASGIKQNQAISYITSYLANCYDENFMPLDDSRHRSDAIGKNIPGHFLIDLLRGTWSGHGDTTLFDRTWERVVVDQDGQGDDVLEIWPAKHYVNPVSEVSLRDAFKTWHTEQLDKKQEKRVAYPKDFKPVLKFIYGPLVSHFDSLDGEFELEHVYPVAVLKKIIADSHLEGLAMGAIGNLMLLPKDINRIKGATLLGDYLLENPNTTPREVNKLQSYLLGPDLTEVCKDTKIDEASFKAFCEARADKMMDHLVNYINLD